MRLQYYITTYVYTSFYPLPTPLYTPYPYIYPKIPTIHHSARNQYSALLLVPGVEI